MIKHTQLTHSFVQHIPERLAPGVLYISIDYATAAHSCCCGCGEEIVTPFTPTDWRMIFDGDTVSLWPSIGNWNLRCRSHYVIDRGRVNEAPPWNDARIAAERRRDKAVKAQYYGASNTTGAPGSPEFSVEKADDLWSRFRRWFSNSL
jgi:hypothetical protein